MNEQQDGLHDITETTDGNEGQRMTDDFADLLAEEIDLAGGEFQEDEAFIGAGEYERVARAELPNRLLDRIEEVGAQASSTRSS